MYDHGRFFTMTGWHLAGTPRRITAYQEALYEVHGRVFGPQALLRPDGTTAAYCPTCDYLATLMASGLCAGCGTMPLGAATNTLPSTSFSLPMLEDTVLLDKAHKARNGAGEKFATVFAGDWSAYGSQSEADLGLCVRLAFWTQDTSTTRSPLPPVWP